MQWMCALVEFSEGSVYCEDSSISVDLRSCITKILFLSILCRQMGGWVEVAV